MQLWTDAADHAPFWTGPTETSTQPDSPKLSKSKGGGALVLLPMSWGPVGTGKESDTDRGYDFQIIGNYKKGCEELPE